MKARHEFKTPDAYRDYLRHYYAGEAMEWFSVGKSDAKRLMKGDKPNHAMVAKFCVDLADAVIAALDAKKEKK